MDSPIRRFLVLLLSLWSLVSLSACDEAEDATAIAVVVDSDLELGSELTSIRVGVLDKDGKEQQQEQTFLLSTKQEKGRHTLPFRFRLGRSSNQAGTYRIVVTGRGPLGADGEEIDVAEQQALVVFRPHVSSRLDMFLARICLGQLCRGQEALLTCDNQSGQCAALPVRGELEQDEAGVMDGLDAGSAKQDAMVPGDAKVEGRLPVGGEDASTQDAAHDAEITGCAPGLIKIAGVCAADPCLVDPCQHGGTCNGSSGMAACSCTDTGYSGNVCQDDINECATAVCAAEYPCVQTAAPGYTCRGQFADWPMPDSAPGAKVAPSYDQRSDVVVDNVTGLWWQQNPPGTTSSTAANYPGCAGATAGVGCTWAEAKSYCDKLFLGGVTDWRLPTKVEFLSIVDTRYVQNPLPSVFLSARSSYWTASAVAGTSDTVWVIQGVYAFALGPPVSLDTATTQVRCVRGKGPDTTGPHYQSDLQTGEVTDRRTSLIWHRNALLVADKTSAEMACSKLGAGWRLPTFKELSTLVDVAHPLDASATIDQATFPDTPVGFYWSSSTLTSAPIGGSSSESVWGLDFGTGLAGSPGTTSYARCVR